jgi:hypothetical protein
MPLARAVSTLDEVAAANGTSFSAMREEAARR